MLTRFYGRFNRWYENVSGRYRRLLAVVAHRRGVTYRAPGDPPTLFYAGPRCEAREVSVMPGTVYWGIRLQPGAAARRGQRARITL